MGGGREGKHRRSGAQVSEGWVGSPHWGRRWAVGIEGDSGEQVGMGKGQTGEIWDAESDTATLEL